ncbi:MAG: hypothetical protein IJ053_04610 [Lachnospiraceae bacterium]|nr:hypothetical protein [Lachnospiraceae bacterium]
MDQLTPEQLEERKKKLKKQFKKIKITALVCLLALIAYGIIMEHRSNRKDVSYSVISTQSYVRDGKECMGYRVYVAKKPTSSEARTIFGKVTNDKYYLHTVWFYTDRNAAKGNDVANWTMEQTSQGSIPTLK